MARAETEGGANRVVSGTIVGNITGGTTAENIIPCTTLTVGAGTANTG